VLRDVKSCPVVTDLFEDFNQGKGLHAHWLALDDKGITPLCGVTIYLLICHASHNT
jgi:hypothetical protein